MAGKKNRGGRNSSSGNNKKFNQKPTQQTPKLDIRQAAELTSASATNIATAEDFENLENISIPLSL
jgi:hypothetical protein